MYQLFETFFQKVDKAYLAFSNEGKDGFDVEAAYQAKLERTDALIILMHALETYKIYSLKDGFHRFYEEKY